MKISKNTFANLSNDNLADIYESTIGHNPFLEGVNRAEVINLLFEYQEEDNLIIPQKILIGIIERLQNALHDVLANTGWHHIGNEAFQNARTALGMEEKRKQECFTECISLGENTGGNIMNDIYRLKNGYIIRISDEGAGIYEDEEKDQHGEPVASVDFPENKFM